MTPTEARALAREISNFGHEIPKPVTQDWLEAMYAKGMIRKADLVHGIEYIGSCRNASVAVWDGEKEVFVYLRQKQDYMKLSVIRHPEDDNGLDLFIPTLQLWSGA